ncbi:MAG: trypsin-like peptidase domain-containing protein [Thiotrichaceae bacterium]|nr:trypsin-like peptidase domain-containing protein [Thiotrichaceae bacterium]
MISNDPLNRKWLDVSATNPNLVNEFRPTIVSFLGFDLNRNPQLMGTGFVIAGDKKYAVILTAKHVIDGLQKFQKPTKHASSAVAGFFIPPKVSLKPQHLKVVWMGQNAALMMNVVYVFYSDQLDIACCVVVPQEKEDKFLPFSIPLDCRTPSVGDAVHMISCAGMKTSEITAPSAQNSLGQTLKIERSVNIRIGSVTGIHNSGYDQYKFPCFTTSIPAEHGMSGGFVYLPDHGKTIAACGVVSSDRDTTHKLRENMCSEEESIISCTWPALGLSVPDSISPDGVLSKETIYEMIKMGRMPVYENSVDQFEIIKLAGDDYRVQRKT